MGFNKIPQNTFNNMLLGAGMLLWNFDPDEKEPVKDEDIICATTGGINPVCKPSFEDMGEDIDNCPKGMAELMNLTEWECGISTTAVDISPKIIQLALGAADIDGAKVTPRMKLKITDFKGIWWVGERADGGMAAIHLMNALSSDGFTLKTADKAKGQVALNLTGHPTLESQDIVPMEFYSKEPAAEVPAA